MLAPSVVTPQNQYFPDNAERMSVHCLESGCIGKYEIALRQSLGPRGAKSPPLGYLLGLEKCIFLSAVYGYILGRGHEIEVSQENASSSPSMHHL